MEGGGAEKGHMTGREGQGRVKSSCGVLGAVPVLAPPSPHSFLPSPFTEHCQRPKHARGIWDKTENARWFWPRGARSLEGWTDIDRKPHREPEDLGCATGAYNTGSSPAVGRWRRLPGGGGPKPESKGMLGVRKVKGVVGKSVSRRGSCVCKGPEEEGVRPSKSLDAAACGGDQVQAQDQRRRGLQLQGGGKPWEGFR